MAFSTLIPLRWGDMDAYGHVNNVVFLSYLEQARVNAFHSTPDDRSGAALLKEGVVVVEHTIRYKRQLPYSHVPLRVVCWTDEIKSATYTTAYKLWNDAGDEPELVATAKTVLAPVNFTSGRPRRLTPEERAFLGRFGPEDSSH